MKQKSLRIALVSETWPPEINGVALTVHGFEQGLRALGHAVSVVRPQQVDEQQTPAGHLLLPSLPLPRYPGLRVGLPATGRLRTQWKRERPDVVYVATEGPLGWSAMRAARKLGIPVASGFHTRFDDYAHRYGVGWLAPIALAWLRHVHNRSQRTLVPTDELQRFLDQRGFERVTRLARAVDTQRFDPRLRSESLRLQWGLQGDAPAVLHVGRIASEKNLSLAVRAFRAIQFEQPAARFVWVGDGPERAALQAANPDFVFVGMQRDIALGRHYASGDLLLFPSLSETFGCVTLEAMASGVPPVAFDYGAAHAHLQHGVHGYAAPPGDEHAFVLAACRLADDRVVRSRMGRAARQACEALSPERATAEFGAVLAGLCSEQAPA